MTTHARWPPPAPALPHKQIPPTPGMDRSTDRIASLIGSFTHACIAAPSRSAADPVHPLPGAFRCRVCGRLCRWVPPLLWSSLARCVLGWPAAVGCCPRAPAWLATPAAPACAPSCSIPINGCQLSSSSLSSSHAQAPASSSSISSHTSTPSPSRRRTRPTASCCAGERACGRAGPAQAARGSTGQRRVCASLESGTLLPLHPTPCKHHSRDALTPEALNIASFDTRQRAAAPGGGRGLGLKAGLEQAIRDVRRAPLPSPPQLVAGTCLSSAGCAAAPSACDAGAACAPRACRFYFDAPPVPPEQHSALVQVVRAGRRVGRRVCRRCWAAGRGAAGRQPGGNRSLSGVATCRASTLTLSCSAGAGAFRAQGRSGGGRQRPAAAQRAGARAGRARPPAGRRAAQRVLAGRGEAGGW